MPSVKPRLPSRKPGLHKRDDEPVPPSQRLEELYLLNGGCAPTRSSSLVRTGQVPRPARGAMVRLIPVCTKTVNMPSRRRIRHPARWTYRTRALGLGDGRKIGPEANGEPGDSEGAATRSPSTVSGPRPVMLATLSVRVDPSAERDGDRERAGGGRQPDRRQHADSPPYPATVMLAREYVTLPHEEDSTRSAPRPPAPPRLGSAPSCCGSRAGARCGAARARDRAPGRAAGVRPGPCAGSRAADSGWPRAGRPQVRAVPGLDRRPRLAESSVRRVCRSRAGCRSGPCRTAAARRRGGPGARPRRSTARGRPRGCTSTTRQPGAPARPPAAAARRATRTSGATGESRWAAKCAAKCSWSWASTLTP